MNRDEIVGTNNNVFVYDRNETMFMLGQQRTVSAFAQFFDMYMDVLTAHPKEGTHGICMDMFSLGIICGKRLERQRRKESAANRGI